MKTTAAQYLLPGLIALSYIPAGLADSAMARCDIYAAGSDHTNKMIPCSFERRQSFITITRDDGVTHDLSPVNDQPGAYRDQAGRPAYRQSGLGDYGLIFRFENESVYVYWDTAALYPDNKDNWSAPFTTADYDATTRLRCRALVDQAFDSCPAGILRMEYGQASIVIRSPQGEQFTINFLADTINATDRDVKASLSGDTWTVVIDGEDVYEIPLAAIEGG